VLLGELPGPGGAGVAEGLGHQVEGGVIKLTELAARCVGEGLGGGEALGDAEAREEAALAGAGLAGCVDELLEGSVVADTTDGLGGDAKDVKVVVLSLEDGEVNGESAGVAVHAGGLDEGEAPGLPGGVGEGAARGGLESGALEHGQEGPGAEALELGCDGGEAAALGGVHLGEALGDAIEGEEGIGGGLASLGDLLGEGSAGGVGELGRVDDGAVGEGVTRGEAEERRGEEERREEVFAHGVLLGVQ
jgi:hypothetical protein